MMFQYNSGSVSLKNLLHILYEADLCEFFCKIELMDDGRITTIVNEIRMHQDEVTLGIILEVPIRGFRSIEGSKPFEEFTLQAKKMEKFKHQELPNKLQKGEYQLLFKFINKVIVLRSKKQTVVLDTHFFLMIT